MSGPGSLRAKRRAIRNLRAAPDFLTSARVNRLMSFLDAARPRSATPSPWPEEPIETPATPRQRIRRTRTEEAEQPIAEPVAAPVASPPAEQVAERSVVVIDHSAAAFDQATRAGQVVVFAAAPAALSHKPISDRRDMIARAAARIQARPGRTPSALEPVSPPVPVKPPSLPISAAAPSPRPAVKTLGVQNVSSAIAWLRAHGVSVSVASSTLRGTRWLVSGDYRHLDAAAIVEFARSKGFDG